jgi:beta-barrel assembly-enhancing protease
MKKVMLTVVFAGVFAGLSVPARAQFGGLLDKAQKVQDAKKKLDSLLISDEEEHKIGESISAKIRLRFGVVQDPAVHKYVTLVGTVMAQQSERPALPWTFIVLDTDGVNAFASPGGFVHITRGALGLVKNEAELAAVLAHEIGHVAHKHTVNAIRKANVEKLGSDALLANRGPYLDKFANLAYDMILEGKFDRNDELDADKESVAITPKAGYASAGLADFLTRLDERNKDQPARNGLFASHPETKERIDTIRKLAGSTGGATVEARYKANVKYEAAPITSIAVVADGASGLTGSSASKDASKDADKDKAKPTEEPKKKGFGLGNLKPSVGQEQQTAQVSASGGARGVGPDRAAKGGSNPNPVKVTVSAAEIDAFKKGIA